MNKKRRVVLVVLIFGILLCACSDKNLEISEKRKAEVQMKTKRLMKRDIIFRLKRKSVRRQKKTVLLP